jgi:argininosuccinate lyase
MKMWSGRFRQALDPQFENWQRSFDFDRRLLRYELAASGAHARALKNAGVLSADELISILKGLDEIRGTLSQVQQDQRDPSTSSGQAVGHPTSLPEDDEAEDVHHFVEKQLVARIGEVGYKLHSGRSRNEQIATVFTCGRRSMSYEKSWRRFAEPSPIAPSKPAARLCRRIRTCSMPSRCWWRIGCSPT